MSKRIVSQTDWVYPARNIGLTEMVTIEGGEQKTKLIVYLDRKNRSWKQIYAAQDFPIPCLAGGWEAPDRLVVEFFNRAFGKGSSDWEGMNEREVFGRLCEKLAAIEAASQLAVTGPDAWEHGPFFAQLVMLAREDRNDSEFVVACVDRMSILGWWAAEKVGVRTPGSCQLLVR